MKRFPIVSSVMTHVRFSESTLENYFNTIHRKDRASKEKFSNDFENIAVRSMHAVAKGSVQIVFGNDESGVIVCLEVPISTYFLASAIKTNKKRYTFAFAASMS